MRMDHWQKTDKSALMRALEINLKKFGTVNNHITFNNIECNHPIQKYSVEFYRTLFRGL